MNRILALTALLLALFACCPSSAAPTPIAATATPGPEPTDTAAPAATPGPTDTPAPTLTPTPAMLTVRDIEIKRKELTDLQWEPYAREIVGQEIRFSGKIIEVHADGRVSISEGKGLFTLCILYEIPLDVAAALGKGQLISGWGTVREVDTMLALAVWINVVSLE